jgi:hypothetical protein
MPATTKMQKYLYKGSATALNGSVRKPYYQNLGSHLAISTYAGSGGITECTNRGFQLGNDVKYASALTRIEAIQKGDEFHTTILAQVFDLKVGPVEVSEVMAQLHSVYNRNEYPGSCVARVLPVNSIIRNLRVNGVVKDSDLKLPKAFSARIDDAFFSGKGDRNPDFEPGFVPTPLYIEGVGTIFYGEWTWIHPTEREQQKLTMLRLALGSDFGSDTDVCSVTGDGVGWPPPL